MNLVWNYKKENSRHEWLRIHRFLHESVHAEPGMLSKVYYCIPPSLSIPNQVGDPQKKTTLTLLATREQKSDANASVLLFSILQSPITKAGELLFP